MFKFDLDVNAANLIVLTTNNEVTHFWVELEMAINKFIPENHETTCLQLEEELTSAKESFFSYSIQKLSSRYGSNTPTTAIIANYDEASIHHPDLLVTLLSQFTALISKLDKPTRKHFFSSISQVNNIEGLCSVVPGFKDVIGIDKSRTKDIKPIERSEFVKKLTAIIQLYCQHIGKLIIAITKIDSLSAEDQDFVIQLFNSTPNKLCLVATYKTNTLEFSKERESIVAKNKSIATKTIKLLLRKYFKYNPRDEKQLVNYILVTTGITTAKQAIAMVESIVEICPPRSAANTDAKKQNDDADEVFDTTDLAEIEKYYLFEPERARSILKGIKETCAETKVRCLCLILGPYIRLEDLKQIYKFCCNEEYPSDIDYAKISLLNNDGHIRHIDLATYDRDRDRLRKISLYRQLVSKVQNGLSQCEAIRRHIDRLYARRNQLSKVIGVRPHQAIIALFGLEQNKSLERGLSGSTELENDWDDNEDPDCNLSGSALPDSASGSKAIISLSTRDLELAINCSNEIICNYSAKKNMVEAFSHCRVATDLINGYLPVKYQNEIDAYGLLKIIFPDNKSTDEALPFSKIDSSLHDVVSNILGNMCMIAYFLNRTHMMSKYAFLAFCLQQENSVYLPIIQICIAVIFSLAADNELRRYANAKADKPVRFSELPDPELATYKKFRAAATSLTMSAIKRLKTEPSLPERGLAWSMISALLGIYTEALPLLYSDLLVACYEAMQNEDPFKAVLLLGNQILVEIVAGLPPLVSRESCKECIELCERSGIHLSMPIIQELLAYVNYRIKKDTTGLNLKAETEGPNRCFINYARFLILFKERDFKACVALANTMRELDFVDTKNSNRIGYNFIRDFEVLATIAELWYLESDPSEQTTERIKRIRADLIVVRQYSEDNPDNFSYRHELLYAVIQGSRLSNDILGCHTLPLSDQLISLTKALRYASEWENCLYIDEISAAIDVVTKRLKKQTTPFNSLFQNRNHVSVPKSNSITKSYDELLLVLLARTKSNTVLLFEVEGGELCLPPVIVFGKGHLVSSLKAAARENPFAQKQWYHQAVTDSFNSQNLIYFSSEDCTKVSFLKKSRIRNVIVIPIFKKGMKGILYVHGAIEQDFTSEDLQKFGRFAITFYDSAIKNKSAVEFIRTEATFEESHSNSASVSSQSSASRSSSSSSQIKLNTSANTTNNFTPAFFASEPANANEKEDSAYGSADTVGNISASTNSINSIVDNASASEPTKSPGSRPGKRLASTNNLGASDAIVVRESASSMVMK